MKNKATKGPTRAYPPQMRIVGQHPSASAVLAQAGQSGLLPITTEPVIQVDPSDYAQIDNGLTVSAARAKHADAPTAGLGYAGLTPAQRHEFLLWLQAPVVPAPAAFRHLCLANLEVRLLENPEWAFAARGVLLELDEAASWEGDERLARSLLLAFWLAQDGAPLASWIASSRAPSALLGIALGCQAMLGAALSAHQALAIAAAWRLPRPFAPPPVIALRLASLQGRLGAELLVHALAQATDDARQARPWRCTHRDLRLAFPQPDLRPALLPFLAEITEVETAPSLPNSESPSLGSVEESDEDGLDSNTKWNVILEFQEGTSSLSPIAVRRAQRLAGYGSLMDEHRRVIHRVRFHRREMRNFWPLWEVVQDWTHTHVYLNGVELERWKVTPYANYLA
jgi:hypothetical protein